MMNQIQVNRIVSRIIRKNHKGRGNAILFKELAAIIIPAGATKGQIREAIRVLRCHRKPISSRPNVGYYFDKSEMKGCRTWVENLRKSKRIVPDTPVSLRWV